jgi:hypothetical protein
VATEWEGNKPGRRRKKNLWTKDMTDVKTSIDLWTKDVTNIRCHVWCYWEQEFGEPMGTYLTHHWLVSETVVVDKKNTSVGWVFDFFVIPICSDYLEEKKQNEKTIGFGYLKIFRIKRIIGLGYFIKKKQNHRIMKEPEWEMPRIGRGGLTG